jgi:hypothetical protein
MCAANSVVKRDEAGNRKLDKAKSRGRIDGMVSLTMACSVASEALGQSKVFSNVDPETKSIIMRDCILGNQPATAKKIFDGDNKTVCAWVACDDVSVVDSLSRVDHRMTRFKYNPRKNPHWFSDASINCDNRKFKVMITNNRKVYG